MSDGKIERALGAVEGELKTLVQAFRDEKEVSRRTLDTLVGKLNRLEDEMGLLKAQIKPISSQLYSNKVEIDRVNGVLRVVQTIYSRAMGVFWVFSIIMGMIFTGIWWVLGHWGEIYGIFRGLMGTKGP